MGIIADFVGIVVVCYLCAVGATATFRKVRGWYRAAKSIERR